MNTQIPLRIHIHSNGNLVLLETHTTTFEGIDDNMAETYPTNSAGVTDHLAELAILLDRIQMYQHRHADLVSSNPQIDAYWHAGSQIVAAALQIKSAIEMVRSGKALEQ